MDDVVLGGRDLEEDEPVLGRDEAVDRDHTVRIPVLPVELPALDADPKIACLRLVLERDPGQLVEGEGDDEEEDHDRDERPRDLQLRRTVDLRPLDGAGASPAPIADDEDRQRHRDRQQHEGGPEGDEPVEVRDPLGVR